MGGEDFAKYPQEKCILLLGGGWPEEERQFPQHSPFFDIDESALSLGVEYFVEMYRNTRRSFHNIPIFVTVGKPLPLNDGE